MRVALVANLTWPLPDFRVDLPGNRRTESVRAGGIRPDARNNRWRPDPSHVRSAATKPRAFAQEGALH